jgi:hypothetical protein
MNNMKLVLLHFISLSVLGFLSNYCYATSPSEQQPNKFVITESELLEQIYAVLKEGPENGVLKDNVFKYIEENLEKVVILPSSNDSNEPDVVDDSLHESTVEDDSLHESTVEDDSLHESIVEDDSLHQPVIQDNTSHEPDVVVNNLHEPVVYNNSNEHVVEDNTSHESVVYNNSNEHVVEDNTSHESVVKNNDSHEHVVDDSLHEHDDQIPKVQDIVKKIESNKSRIQLERIGTTNKETYNNSDVESIVKSLQEIKDFTLTNIPNMSDYIPVKDSINFKKSATDIQHPVNSIGSDKSSSEIKSIVSEILELIRTSYEVSTIQNQNIRELLDKYNSKESTDDLLSDLVTLVSTLETTKFPFSMDDDFIKHATDKNPESITYSDIHQNNWVWRSGDNSLDNFNTTVERRVSGDYRKNNMLVRFHKIVRDNKISDTYEEVINTTSSPQLEQSTNEVHDTSDNVETVNSRTPESDKQESNGIQIKQSNVLMFIPLIFLINFIL